MNRSSFTFERLIAPTSRDEFLSQYWEKKPLIINREPPSACSSLFCFSDIDQFLQASRESAAGLLHIVPASGSGREHRVFKGKEILPDTAYKAFSSGDTLQLAAVHMLWPSVAGLRSSMYDSLLSDIWINAYATPAGAQGLPVHIDTHDTLILQVDGSKNWSIYDRYIDVPLDTERSLSYVQSSLREELADREDELTLLCRVRLERGDVIYLPRGFPHKAVATEEASLHLTVGILPIYWVDFLKAAIETICLEHADLRRAMPPGFIDDPQARSSAAEEFHKIMTLVCRAANFDRVFEEFARRHTRNQSFPADGHFFQITKLADISIDSMVRRRKGLTCYFAEEGDARYISFGKCRIKAPRRAGPALSFICKNRDFRVGDLPGHLDEQSKVMLVRHLIRDGLLQAAPSPPEQQESKAAAGASG